MHPGFYFPPLLPPPTTVQTSEPDQQIVKTCSTAAHSHSTWRSSGVNQTFLSESPLNTVSLCPHLFVFRTFPAFTNLLKSYCRFKIREWPQCILKPLLALSKIYTLIHKVHYHNTVSGTNLSPPICTPHDWVCNTAVCVFYNTVCFTALCSRKNAIC